MIGIFDSGAGGLTITREIQAALPGYDLVYFGDTARYPYGNQSQTLLQRYAAEDAALLRDRGATVIVIACNSASAAAGEYLRARLAIPVFDVIGPAVEAALAATRSRRVGVIGTKATVQSGAYERALAAAGCAVVARATPMLVPLVEERWWKHPESMRVVRRSLLPVKQARVDTLILGCTHYPMLEPLIRRAVGKRVAIVNPAHATAAALARYLAVHPALDASLHRSDQATFLVSADPASFAATARWWLGRAVEVTEARTASE
jgi:glutamate racemase